MLSGSPSGGRYGERVNEEELERLAHDLGVQIDKPTIASLERSVRVALRDLQIEPSTPEQLDRRQRLTDALGRLNAESDDLQGSSALVKISRGELSEIVQAAVKGSRDESNPGLELRTGVQVAASQARKDFRNARSLPFAGFGAFVLLVWSQREAFGVDLTETGSAVFGAAAAALILTALVGFYVAWRVQRRDEHILRALYRPDTHAYAIRAVGGNQIFLVEEFRRALEAAVRGRGYRRRMRLLSTVDLDSALDDAAELALERFVTLGVIEPVESWSGLEYRRTERFSGV